MVLTVKNDVEPIGGDRQVARGTVNNGQTALGQLPSEHPPGASEHRRRGVDPDDVATGRNPTKQLAQPQATAESDVSRPIPPGDPAASAAARTIVRLLRLSRRAM